MSQDSKRIIRRTSGSITVEAAFVMPIVILTVFALIYLSFYLRDICRIQGILDVSVHQAALIESQEVETESKDKTSNANKEQEDLRLFFRDTEKESEELKQKLEAKLSRGLFLIKTKNIEGGVSQLTVKASVKTHVEVSLPLFSYLFNSMPDKVLRAEYAAHAPAEAVRCLEVILDTGADIKGFKSK